MGPEDPEREGNQVDSVLQSWLCTIPWICSSHLIRVVAIMTGFVRSGGEIANQLRGKAAFSGGCADLFIDRQLTDQRAPARLQIKEATNRAQLSVVGGGAGVAVGLPPGPRGERSTPHDN